MKYLRRIKDRTPFDRLRNKIIRGEAIQENIMTKIRMETDWLKYCTKLERQRRKKEKTRKILMKEIEEMILYRGKNYERNILARVLGGIGQDQSLNPKFARAKLSP